MIAAIGLLTVGVTSYAKVTVPPARIHVSKFYQKYVQADGIAILASKNVSNCALLEAANIVSHMLQDVRPDAVRTLAKTIHVAIIGAHEVTTDIPEYRNLNKLYPPTNWNTRTRGIGATPEIPVASGAEENLLGLPGDRYRGEGIFLHEFGHTIADMGMAVVDKTFDPTLKADYKTAIAKGLWKNTYAATNFREYWAEGVEDFFGCNISVKKANGVHNSIATRAQLKSYDPGLYALLLKTFGNNPWNWHYPSKTGR